MALTPSHGAIGALPSIALTIGIFGINPITIVLASLWGAYAAYKSTLPDIYGILGGAPKDYTVYIRAHFGDIAEANKKNIYYSFHLWWDKWFHRVVPPYGWIKEGIFIEAIQILVLIGFYMVLVGLIATLYIFVGLCLYLAVVRIFRDTIKTMWLAPYLR